MKIQNSIFIIFSVIFLFSCKPNNDKQFEEFKTYLHTFNLSPSDTCVYIFIPANQCQNCILLDGAMLPEELKKRLFVFSGFPEKTVSNFQHFYYDNENKMMQLEFVDYSNKIIRCENNKLIMNEVIIDFYEQMKNLPTKK